MKCCDCGKDAIAIVDTVKIVTVKKKIIGECWKSIPYKVGLCREHLNEYIDRNK